jgi:hypothetical protein
MHTLSLMCAFVSFQSMRRLTDFTLFTTLQFYKFQASLNHRAIACSCCSMNPLHVVICSLDWSDPVSIILTTHTIHNHFWKQYLAIQACLFCHQRTISMSSERGDGADSTTQRRSVPSKIYKANAYLKNKAKKVLGYFIVSSFIHQWLFLPTAHWKT